MSIKLKHPSQITVDTIHINKFEVATSGGVEIAIHFSKGYKAGTGFVAVEHGRVDLRDPAIDPKLRDAVKTAMYGLLQDKLDAIAAEAAKATPKQKAVAP